MFCRVFVIVANVRVASQGSKALGKVNGKLENGKTRKHAYLQLVYN